MKTKFTDEVIKQIKENNAKITELLEQNEQLIKDTVPQNSFAEAAVDGDDKINFPKHTIRQARSIVSAKKLDLIIPNPVVRKNVAYSYQLADWYAFMINRIYTWGSLEKMILKNGVINLISIFEALTLECANNICCSPGACKAGRKRKCTQAFNREERNNIMRALKRMNELSITSFSEKDLEKIQKYIDFRNRVHIRLTQENEFLSGDFKISVYNNIVEYLSRLSDDILKNGVPMYHSEECDET